MSEAPLPFKPGDWAVDGSERVAKVKSVWREEGSGDVLLNLILYDWTGEKVGRESPVEGGPRSYEPACDASRWQRIGQPTFPIHVKWVDRGDGRRVAQMWAGDRLPPANYVPKPRRSRMSALTDDRYRRALKDIAAGHNDPRALAAQVLGRRR